MSASENDKQPVQQSNGSENPAKPVGMLTYFWWTILALIPITVVLLILAMFNQIEQRKGPILKSVLRPELFEKTGKIIDEKIDLAFKPIYAGIPEFLDWHYSVVGQYQQLGVAALGKLESQMEERLFSGVKERLENASANIDETFKTEFRSLLSQKIHDEIQTVDDVRKIFFKRAWNEAMQDSMQRFSLSVGVSGAFAVLAGTGGVAFVSVITKAMSKKLIASVAIKTAGKTAAKTGGAGGAAASGAAVGSVLGPPGAVIGGIVGGVAGWLGTDAVVVNVDEYLNRDKFEQELIALVDESKARTKSDMKLSMHKTLEGVTPSKL